MYIVQINISRIFLQNHWSINAKNNIQHKFLDIFVEFLPSIYNSHSKTVKLVRYQKSK